MAGVGQQGELGSVSDSVSPPFLSPAPCNWLSLEKTKGILLVQGFSVSKFILNIQKKVKSQL